MTARLRSVPKQAEEVRDITALLRADIEKRDWSAVHVAGDRGAVIALPPFKHRRWWR